ncbi:pyrroline-5-carboxylate reductase [Comamonas aquatica]|uniref:Pyrroline-5-carboxylate reductase n=1 Tax=Comamonas aquatica TaxID=225991 RepID=A0AA42W3K1_9BURK|nr:pyrroline-5-carboxylate reductase [Comamonas aquatica]MDH0493747.1 pyrroline-5-carboxylate reductase [Comamonas aquatica]MDH1378271.1 pyrroline-5-carboxylate reductase [Comamonas aquatica]MDH1430122.1 pyrroline-5-carboxylate reductase [Comamonas aquatica]MDH1606842.1 pyrroline-5-carboxylate reductase [Comamonas aquatica]MDH1618265.1 pyrroline-5-carboxylate reductase [Comamonas aquatica]
MSQTPSTRIAFIGGGNMASAIIGGLIANGLPASQITVVEPFEAARDALKAKFGIDALPAASAALAGQDLVVWAVKPQTFKDAAAAAAPHTAQALHLSVAAGITTDSIAQWLGTGRIVRAMPNTPALVGKGMTGLFARPEVDAGGQALIERVIGTTGQLVWVDAEAKLDAVTALSGSGPAYVFLFLEAMTQAGVDMGLTAEQAYQLAVATFQGASELAARSDEPASVLRERVTSKGGTTYAAITHMQQAGLPQTFIAALRKAEARAQELAQEFGR